MGKSLDSFVKYPRTPHLFGSKRVDDDRQLSEKASLRVIQETGLIIEEKVDGANTGIHFDEQDKQILQTRGHILTKGEHPQFDLFKSWAIGKKELLYPVLGKRYIMYGEWLYAKHNLFYDKLPHYFLEFDIYDKEQGCFLDSASRQSILSEAGIFSVPVIRRGAVNSLEELQKLIATSHFTNQLMEGLYLKIEKDGRVVSRCKYVRASFTEGIKQQKKHWAKFKLTPNQLLSGPNIWV